MNPTAQKPLTQLVRDAGVVGAGGAGFPTYKKIETPVDTLVANGAECEPLLLKDQALMEHFPAEIIDGMTTTMRHVGAKRGIIAIKGKNRTSIESIKSRLTENITVFEMDDVYPAGDEYEVVFHSMGRRIPAGRYPSDIGVLVQNVETLYNISRASKGLPIIQSMITVHGFVREPVTTWVPVGMSYGEVLKLAGGPTIDDFVMLDGGPMMGTVTRELATPVTRITSGITVIARDSTLATRKTQSDRSLKRFGKSACDQCSLCTEMCPRYLLGYPVKPHLVMRSLQTSGENNETLSGWAQPCSECNVCSLWACPEGLDPKGVCVAAKVALTERNAWLAPERLQQKMTDPHRLKSYRSVPTSRLKRRLGLGGFVENAPFESKEVMPESVAIPLKQHAGNAAVPVVAEGDRVSVGDQIARAADDALSVPIHASIDGMVTSVGDRIVIER